MPRRLVQLNLSCWMTSWMMTWNEIFFFFFTTPESAVALLYWSPFQRMSSFNIIHAYNFIYIFFGIIKRGKIIHVVMTNFMVGRGVPNRTGFHLLGKHSSPPYPLSPSTPRNNHLTLIFWNVRRRRLINNIYITAPDIFHGGYYYWDGNRIGLLSGFGAAVGLVSLVHTPTASTVFNIFMLYLCMSSRDVK